MRQLYYTNYQSGHSGLSNGIMSIECGVVMAFLTNRFLLLDGNVSPPANIVEYNGRVDNTRPSRVTDLIDIPVPWAEPDPAEIAGLTSRELTEHSLMDCVFYVPGTVDINSPDARSFSRGRNHWLCEDEALAAVDLLRVSEQPMVPGRDHHRHNLSFYSYLFYLDPETRRAVYQLLGRMQAQEPYARLASRVAADLGEFNAIHMRRGDFKVTYGVTVLDRSPWEAIDAMQPHFPATERLLICTDERDDPFFDEIKAHWRDHVFIDHHILDNYASEFAALPQHDSLALAYLSQLVAAESRDFMGSMTSTFTAMIQRLRGNRGQREDFKFLWNELPEPGEELKRGSHPVSDCVPMENGVMVPEFDGPYSWNRYTDLINPAWMREWPESFLREDIAEHAGVASGPVTALSPVSTSMTDAFEGFVAFGGLKARVSTRISDLVTILAGILSTESEAGAGSVILEIGVRQKGIDYLMEKDGAVFAETRELSEVPGLVLRELATLFARARHGFSWMKGYLLKRGEQVILYVGDVDDGRQHLVNSLALEGWDLLGDEVIPLRADSAEAFPLVNCLWSQSGHSHQAQAATALTGVVIGSRRLHHPVALEPLSPALAVAELTSAALDFPGDRESAVSRLCELAIKVPAYQLSFSLEAEVPLVLERLNTLDAQAKKQAGGER